MSKYEKLINKLKSNPKDFTYDELKIILNKFGFYENNKGKTSGSRIAFINEKGAKIEMHKPHPKNILKPYQIKNILNELKKWEVL